MEEDFHEADVLWPEAPHRPHLFQTVAPSSSSSSTAAAAAPSRHRNLPSSAGAAARRSDPIKIQAASTGSAGLWKVGLARTVDGTHSCGGYELSTDDADGASCREMVPPHVLIAARRCSGKVAFSVCSGSGRTLKGRDLSRFRNSILRRTGFLEGDAGGGDFERGF